MKNDFSERDIDRILCDVPLPTLLLKAVSVEAVWSDEVLDQLMQHVEIPHDLHARMKNSLNAKETNRRRSVDLERKNIEPASQSQQRWEGRDESVRKAALPSDSLWSSLTHNRVANQVYRKRPRRISVLSLEFVRECAAVAAILMLICGTFFSGTLLSRWLSNGSRMVAGTTANPSGPAGSLHTEFRATPGTQGLPSKQQNVSIAPRLLGVRENESTSNVSAPMPDKNLQNTPSLESLSESSSAQETTRPGTGISRTASDVLGSPLGTDRTGSIVKGAEGMRLISGPRLSHRAIPRVRGYDLGFEMTYGESPFVDPSIAVELSTSRPPLGFATDSFDAIAATLRTKGFATAAKSARVEDFLAATGSQTKKMSSTEVTLEARLIRSLRTNQLTHIVEFVIESPSIPRVEAMESVLVLDGSANVGSALAWKAMCRGLRAIVEQMIPQDRMSLVLFGRRAELIASKASREELDRLCTSVENHRPQGAADFDAAMNLVDGLMKNPADQMDALNSPATPSLVIVAHADSVERADGRGRDAFLEWQRMRAADSGIDREHLQFVVIDPSKNKSDDGPSLESFGKVPLDGAAIRRSMLERFFKNSGAVASELDFEVSFNPHAVSAWRLLGYRQGAIESLSPKLSTASLHASERVRVAYEVVARESGGKLASAKLLYREKKSDAQRSKTVVVSLTSLGVTTSVLPVAQDCETLLAIGVAEVAAGSAHLESRTRSAASLHELVRRWRDRGDLSPKGEILSEMLSLLMPAK